MMWGFAVLAAVLLLFHGSNAFSATLSDQYQLEWEYNESTIQFKITAATRGYVGIGFSQTTTMEKSDIIIAGVRNDVPYVWDCYSEGNGDLTIDNEQDVTITEGFENSTHTVVTVTRSLFTNQSNDYNLKSGEVNVIWAFGQDDKGPQLLRSDYHGLDRGLQRLELIQDSPDRTDAVVKTTARTFPLPLSQTHGYSNPSHHGAELPYKAFLDRNDQVSLRWDFDNETLVLQLTAPTLGWIGIGFSTKVSMAGADLIMMGYRSNGTYAINCHADRNGLPAVDDQQDIQIISGWENGTHTSVRIMRKLKPCNKQDLNIHLERTLRVLWAYGDKDVMGTSPEQLNYHGPTNRGGRSLILTNDQKFSTVEGIGSGLKHWDAVVENVSVPALTTYYRCVMVKVPSTGTFYVKAFEPVLELGNEKNIHHVLIYACSRTQGGFEHGKSGECYTELNPYEKGCSMVIAGWGIGSIGVAFPEKTAFALPEYVIVEVHYDNPARREFIDNSGMRFHYSHQKPEIFMGSLQIEESIAHIVVPPRSENFLVAGYCQPECIAKGMESSGVSEVTVYSAFLHSHTAGRAIRVRHFRDGKELKPLSQDENYDFDYQETRHLPAGTIIKSGDSLRVECVYDTRDRVNVTTGGLPTSSEMCMAFLNYYPAIGVSLCSSRPKLTEDLTVALKFATDLGLTISPQELETLTTQLQSSMFPTEVLSPLLNRVNWTDEKRRILANFMDNISRYPLCLGGNRFIMNYLDEFKAPKFKDFVQIDDEKCLEMGKTETVLGDEESDGLAALKAAAAAIVFLLAGVGWKLIRA